MDPNTPVVASDLARRFGYWSAAFLTISGIVYALVVGYYVSGHGLAMPPPNGLQFFGAVVTILDSVALVILMASVHEYARSGRRLLSLLALLFTALFCAMVTINRFVQLSVVRRRLSAGESEAISWFLPYGSKSAMLALEILGWSFFLSLATLCAAPLFSKGRLELAIRVLLTAYGVLGLVSAVSFLAGSPLAGLGILAWGVVLPSATACLALFFRRAAPKPDL